jgi:molecular chaperone HscA
VDADGLLQVEASEQTSGVSASVEVKPSYGLNDGEITGMLQASIEHAREDMDVRRLVEEKVEARRVIEALDAALARDGDQLLSGDERAKIDRALAALRATVESAQDAGALEAAIKQLERDCEFYVERRMNSSVRQAMAGHRVDEFVQPDGQEAD